MNYSKHKTYINQISGNSNLNLSKNKKHMQDFTLKKDNGVILANIIYGSAISKTAL